MKSLLVCLDFFFVQIAKVSLSFGAVVGKMPWHGLLFEELLGRLLTLFVSMDSEVEDLTVEPILFSTVDARIVFEVD